MNPEVDSSNIVPLAPTNEVAQSTYQMIYVRTRALKEAVKWCKVPGIRPSDVVATAVWFEDFLLNGENYTRPDNREDPASGRNEEP